jgi:MarR family transcriptional regulator, transcriptional regulator for hemolysin
MSWDPESTAAYWISRTSKALVREFDACLRPFGFAMSYFPVLRALADGQWLSQTELAQAAGVEQPSMAETLARMERDGVVQRKPNPNDKRGTLLSVTPRARAQFPKAKAALSRCERQAMAGFDESEQVVLRDLLKRMAANLDEERRKSPSKECS